MAATNSDVDQYFKNAKRWPKELAALRKILRGCNLTEQIKWRTPCYSYEGGNVAILGEQKAGCTLSFLKGALLQDPNRILEKPGANSQAARVIRFIDIKQISESKSTLEAYIHEAIHLEITGAKIDFKAKDELTLPAELLEQFKKTEGLQIAFDALTPGRQRAYLLHFTSPKQSKTRTTRIQNYVSRILSGKGFHDCVCGLSKRLPTCDGSHKELS